MNDTFTVLAASIVLIMWVASGIVGTLTRDWTFMQLVTPVVLLLGGYLFGKPIFDRRYGNGGPR